MKFKLTVTLLLSVFLTSTASARIWTDAKNRKINATLVRVDGDNAVLLLKGKEIDYPIAKLSQLDQDFIKTWQEENKDKPVAEEATPSADTVPHPGEVTVCNTAIDKTGKVTIVEEAANEKVLKKYSKASAKPTKVKIGIALPKNFNPDSPQRVMWVSAAINNDAERKRGNLGAINAYAKTATEAGWVVIAADTDQGNPRLEDNQNSDGGDLEVHTQAIEALTKAWPKFKSWEFACCGHSGGAKASFYRVGELLVSDLNVTGLYLSGCNQDMTEAAKKETRCRKSGFRNIKVWISNGKKDGISKVSHAEAIQKSIKENRYGDIKLELFDGGHSIHQESFKNAMEWFAITADK